MRAFFYLLPLLLLTCFACQDTPVFGDASVSMPSGRRVLGSVVPPFGPAGGDMTGSYPNPQVAQLTGSAGTVTQHSGTTIALNQGGTLVSPTVETIYQFNPKDTTKGPFVWRQTDAFFNTTDDAILSIGYNAGIEAPAEPRIQWSIESDYDRGADKVSETYWAMYDPSRTNAVRTHGAVMQRGTGFVSSYVSYAGAIGGFQINGGATPDAEVLQATFNDGSVTFSPDPYTVQFNGASTIQGPKPWVITNSGAYGTVGASGLNADVIAFGNRSGSTKWYMDTFNFTLALYPAGGVAGQLGASGSEWTNVFTKALTVAVVPTNTATIGVNGAPPAQVAGYMPITVNGTSYKIPLYNP